MYKLTAVNIISPVLCKIYITISSGNSKVHVCSSWELRCNLTNFHRIQCLCSVVEMFLASLGTVSSHCL